MMIAMIIMIILTIIMNNDNDNNNDDDNSDNDKLRNFNDKVLNNLIIVSKIKKKFSINIEKIIALIKKQTIYLKMI